MTIIKSKYEYGSKEDFDQALYINLENMTEENMYSLFRILMEQWEELNETTNIRN